MLQVRSGKRSRFLSLIPSAALCCGCVVVGSCSSELVHRSGSPKCLGRHGCGLVSGTNGGKGWSQDGNALNWYWCQLLAMRGCSLNVGLGTIVGCPRLSEGSVVARSLKGELVAWLLLSTSKCPAVNLSLWGYRQLPSYLLFSEHLVSPAPSGF